jgi:choline dehydrogenase-like flavoprotein
VDFDAIVIGSGAGGGTIAGELAARGWRVLLAERGRPVEDPELFQDERAMLERRIASDDRGLRINGRATRPIVGSLPGGSTALFGAVMMRPSPVDFSPGAAYGERIPSAIADWPIDYATLEPHLERAEDLFEVAGESTNTAPHLGRRRTPYKAALPPLEPVNQRLHEGWTRRGHGSFRLPLAIDFGKCRRCSACPGLMCPADARGSSLQRAVLPRLGSGLELWAGAEVTLLEWRGRRVEAVWIRANGHASVARVSAPVVVLSAGAIGSPAILLASGIPDASGQLGRNHMCHLGTLAIAAFREPVGAADRFVKQLGWSDDYLGIDGFSAKLGVVQQIPIPGPRAMARQLGLPIPRGLAERLRSRLLLFAGTLEDLPHPDNRVELDRRGGIALRRRYGRYDVARARRWARHIARRLRRGGADVALHHVARRSHDHLAHQVGTCRFGVDPRHAVLDADCRVHAMDNLWVVDGSFMPTSLGVGPALTIAANALRVADALDGGGRAV